MKIGLIKNDGCGWYYNEIYELSYTQKQYDCVLKHLDFDKLDKTHFICFNNEKTEEWFYKTYISSHDLNTIYNHSPLGYQWLKENWGNGVFELYIYYQDKQELKTIANKVINIELIRGQNEN